MSRKTKARAPVEPGPSAQVADFTQPRVAPHNSPTTSLVVEATRKNQAEGGPAYARAEMIAALCGCALYSIETDGVAATLALLADAASVVRQGFVDAGQSPGSRIH